MTFNQYGKGKNKVDQMKRYLLVIAMVVAVAGTLMASTVTYDTTYAWDGSSTIQPFGVPNTTTYGQTFFAPTGSNVDMNNFTFYLQGQPGTHLDIEAQIYAWSGSMTGGNPPQGAVGPALFDLPSLNFDGTGAFQAVTINTGNLSLIPGAAYIALFTVSNSPNYANSNGTVAFGDLLFQHVAGNGGGGFNFYNNGNCYSCINTTPWDDFADFGDLAWTANFTVGQGSVPEPASLLLLGSGLLGLGRLVRKSSKKA